MFVNVEEQNTINVVLKTITYFLVVDFFFSETAPTEDVKLCSDYTAGGKGHILLRQ